MVMTETSQDYMHVQESTGKAQQYTEIVLRALSAAYPEGKTQAEVWKPAGLLPNQLTAAFNKLAEENIIHIIGERKNPDTGTKAQVYQYNRDGIKKSTDANLSSFTGEDTMNETKTVVGPIKAKSHTGNINIGDTWYNQGQKKGLTDDVKAGDNVMVEYSESRNEGTGTTGRWISKVVKVPAETGEEIVVTEETIGKPTVFAEVPPSQYVTVPLTKDRIIVRQNALSHADAWLQYLHDGVKTGGQFIVDEEKYFAFAKKCEEWVMRDD